MRSYLRNKGQVSQLAPAIIAILIAGIFLVMGLIMIQTTRDSDIVRKANNAYIGNETVAMVNATVARTLAANSADGALCTILVVTNESTGHIINAANYTSTGNGCNIVGSAAISPLFNNTNWNISYGYTYGDEAYVGSNSSLTGLATFGEQMELIVLGVILTIVIGLLLVAFGRRSR